jgi:drug/metabolite transporter (DMT)-like permease
MRAIDWLLLVLLSVLWGASYFFIAVANPHVPPFTLALGRVALAAVVLVPLVLLLGLRLPATAADWRPFLGLAIVGNAVPFTLMVHGQLRIAGGLAAVLNATTPLLTLVVARVFAGEALAGRKLAGVVIGLAGVGILVGPAALGSNASSVIGMACILGGSLSYAVSALWMRRLRHIPPLVSSALTHPTALRRVCRKPVHRLRRRVPCAHQAVAVAPGIEAPALLPQSLRQSLG